MPYPLNILNKHNKRSLNVLPESMTVSVILMALLASCGGCIIRYAEIYKHKYSFKLSFLLVDLITAGLSGFFFTWFLLDHVNILLSQVMLILMITGFIGSKILDIAAYILYKKLGIQIKFNKDINNDISKQRPTKL